MTVKEQTGRMRRQNKEPQQRGPLTNRVVPFRPKRLVPFGPNNWPRSMQKPWSPWDPTGWSPSRKRGGPLQCQSSTSAEILDYCRNHTPNENESSCIPRLHQLSGTPYRIEGSSGSSPTHPEELGFSTGHPGVASRSELGGFGVRVRQSLAVALHRNATAEASPDRTGFLAEFREFLVLNKVPA
jgi:hypothetical protein